MSTVDHLTFPFLAPINEREALLFFSSGLIPPRCAFCSRTKDGPALVTSGGKRIDVVYSKELLSNAHQETTSGDPICWACVRDRAHGERASSVAWRTAAAGFLNALHASDPIGYYCGIHNLG